MNMNITLRQLHKFHFNFRVRIQPPHGQVWQPAPRLRRRPHHLPRPTGQRLRHELLLPLLLHGPGRGDRDGDLLHPRGHHRRGVLSGEADVAAGIRRLWTGDGNPAISGH